MPRSHLGSQTSLPHAQRQKKVLRIFGSGLPARRSCTDTFGASRLLYLCRQLLPAPCPLPRFARLPARRQEQAIKCCGCCINRGECWASAEIKKNAFAPGDRMRIRLQVQRALVWPPPFGTLWPARTPLELRLLTARRSMAALQAPHGRFFPFRPFARPGWALNSHSSLRLRCRRTTAPRRGSQRSRWASASGEGDERRGWGGVASLGGGASAAARGSAG